MISICSYCRKVVGEKEPLDQKDISHTICDDCFAHYMPFIEGLKLGEYLDRFDAPVAIVDDDLRVLACNSRFSATLDRHEAEVVGFLGGEVFECKRARLPEGCGKTQHCQTCTLRRALTATIQTSTPQKKVPAYVDTGSGRRDIVLSTDLKDGRILVKIEDDPESIDR